MLIRPLDSGDIPGLADLLVEAVADGASIGFMAGFDADAAMAFWTARAAAMAQGDLVILVAETGDGVVAETGAGVVAKTGDGVAGTITLALATPPNQPHRADVQKMIVGKVARRSGLGAALLAAAEIEARRLNRSLLVLDTISHSAAARLYERCGWTRVGEIPGYALMPQGGLAPTTVYFKRL